MPFLLMVFLVFVCMPDVGVWPEPLWTSSPSWCVAVTWLAVALTGVHAFLVARRVRRPLEGDPALRERLLVRYDRGRFYQQIGLFVVYLLSLTVFGWGWAVAQSWTWDGQTMMPAAELFVLAPFLASQMLAWAIYYDVERASHRAAYRLLAAEANAGTWLELERPRRALPPAFGSRAAYVFFQLRQKMALAFLPVFLLLIQKELLRLLPADTGQDWQGVLNLSGIAAVLLVFVTMPWIVRLVLGLTPLPAGPLRGRLEATSRRLHFRCGNILVWNTRNGMANAFVIGILPWIRYVVFTDRLLEDFTPDEVEAVFGHEVGHIRHQHMPYYFAFLMASVFVVGWAVNDLLKLFPGVYLLGMDNYKYLTELLPVVVALLAYIFVVFGFLSRRCERQADVFGCRAVSCTASACRGHAEGMDLAPRGRGLCATGINTFIRALNKVALVNGISRDRPGFLQSWQHSTIARRVEFLQRVMLDPGVERRFQRRIALFKWALFLVLGGAVAFILVQESQPPVAARAAASAPADTH